LSDLENPLKKEPIFYVQNGKWLVKIRVDFENNGIFPRNLKNTGCRFIRIKFRDVK
jgi:hypothetical protein